ncbi:hypothetical protein [Sinomonas atrocyanea]
MAPLSLAGQHPGTGGGALPLVDVAGMVTRIGAAAMSRAHAYARDGRVENLAWHPDISEMTAQVFGTAEEPYEVGVYLKPQQATYRYAGGWCTCPIAADCKHIGAVVLAANTQRLRAEASQKSAARTAEPAWKGELRRIINPAGERHLHGRSGRLGLQFELRDVEARLGGRFARSGARRRGEHRLGMRPVEYNPATGRWLRGDLSWSRFGRPDHVGDFHTPHFELLRELQALRLGTGSGYWNGNDPWLYLDEFTSPLLWTLLGAASPLGLELVAARRGTGVTLADGTAVVGLEALPGEDDPAALRLVPTLAVDGVALPMERAGTIADHGAYAIVRTGADEELIILAQSESRLGERERALLGTPGGVEIPAADRESFLAEFYPDLARSVTITADDAVDLPPVEPPLLVLTASFGPRDELRLAWHWEYPTGDAVRQLPLAAVPGRASTGTRPPRRARSSAWQRYSPTARSGVPRSGPPASRTSTRRTSPNAPLTPSSASTASPCASRGPSRTTGASRAPRSSCSALSSPRRTTGSTSASWSRSRTAASPSRTSSGLWRAGGTRS